MISLFFAGIFLVCLVWELYFGRHWYRNMEVCLHFVQDYVYAGGQAQLEERIGNRKKLLLPVLEVAFHIRRELVFSDYENTNVSDYTYKRDIFALLGNQRITRTLTVDCTKRGYYRLEKADLTTYSMLFRKRFSREWPVDTELYVYAKRVDVSDILVVCERLMGNVQCAKRLSEDPFAYASIREYTVTDPMKAINWKASAKTGDLMVNTFESTLMEKVMIYVDMEDKGILKYGYLTEESISVAATLASQLVARGMEVGIRVNVEAAEQGQTTRNGRRKKGRAGDTASAAVPETVYLEPAGGRKQASGIERMLAKRGTEEKTVAFSSILTAPEEDAVNIIISKNVAENREAIEAFLGQERQGIWIIPVPRGEEATEKVPDHIRTVRREVERS